MTDTDRPGMEESPGRGGELKNFPPQLKTSVSHQILALIGSAFLCFEFLFLILYFDQSWFFLDLRFYGIPAILVSLIEAHLLLSFGESKHACRWFSAIFKGKPLVVYRKWLQINEDGVSFGFKQVRFEAMDELELTLLGNLVMKSRIVCGAGAPFPDKVLKVPFSVADFPTQQILLSVIRRHRQNCVFNKRLTNIDQDKNADQTKMAHPGRLSLKALVQKGPQVTQLATAAMMALLLLDVGYSSFYFLELLKNYYLAETDLLNARPAESSRHFARAEDLRLHPLAISWVSAKFLKSSSVASGIWVQRSRVLWLQGKHEEAIQDGLKAIEETPTNLRHRLYEARLLVDENKIAEAQRQLKKIMEDHKHSFMPRLYTLAIVKDSQDADKLSQEYKTQLDACYNDTYENEPHWPPGGNCFFTELFYSDDTRFVLDRFLGSKYKPPSRPENASKPETVH